MQRCSLLRSSDRHLIAQVTHFKPKPTQHHIQYRSICLLSIDYTSPLYGSTSRYVFSNTTFVTSSNPRPTEGRPCCGPNIEYQLRREKHSASANKWLSRQSSDRFTREAKLQDLKSRAAFKLLEINQRCNIFKPGMTVVDLGYAPGSWSQVAIDLVKPGKGRVVGVDLIPVQPPRGVNGIQGDFLSAEVQARVREFLSDPDRGRVRNQIPLAESEIIEENVGYIDREREATEADEVDSTTIGDGNDDRYVDVVLSDMSAPWEMTSGLWKNSINNPYRRMMNTSGNKIRDHAGSMDLCRAALYFAYETLKVGGSFICKFYQGAEDKQLEKQIKALFKKVEREKPESSRKESKECFFVARKRIADADPHKVFDDGRSI